MNQPMLSFPIKCLSDVQKVDLLSLPHISTGIKSLDRLIEGVFESQLIVVTGKRGQGKSTFASWLLSNALNQDRNIFAYSGELPDYHFRNWLDLQIAGKQNINTTKNEWNDFIYSLNDDAAKKLTDYYSGRAYIYDNSAVTQGRLQDVLLGSIRYAAEHLNCRVVLVDNIMTAVDMLDNDAYAVQSGFVKSLKALCAELKISIILVAHPRKTEQGKALMNDDVSGTADITNLADIVLAYSRLDEKESENGKYHSAISVTKNRLTGKLTMRNKPIKVTYSEMTKRIISDDDTEPNQLMCCFKNDYVPF